MANEMDKNEPDMIPVSQVTALLNASLEGNSIHAMSIDPGKFPADLINGLKTISEKITRNKSIEILLAEAKAASGNIHTLKNNSATISAELTSLGANLLDNLLMISQASELLENKMTDVSSTTAISGGDITSVAVSTE